MLAHWGARSLGPPSPSGDLEPGWLSGALRIALPLEDIPGRIEFRIDDDVASVSEREIVRRQHRGARRRGRRRRPGFYDLMVERDLGAVVVEGDVEAVREMLASLPQVRVPRLRSRD